MKVKFSLRCCNGDKVRELLLPGHYEVCHRCDGEGKHVNPAIDENGISPDEFAEDPDFEEAYFSGVYDVQCEECGGARVLPEVDLDRLPKALRKRIEDYLGELAEMNRERAEEKRLRARGIQF